MYSRSTIKVDNFILLFIPLSHFLRTFETDLNNDPAYVDRMLLHPAFDID